MSEIEVSPVSRRSELGHFVGFPYRLHAADPCWTPPLRRDVRAQLDPAKNPFYEHAERTLFLARRAGRVVGRVAAIDDRLHREVHQEPGGFCG